MTDNYALTHLYHPSGAKVSIPLSLTSPMTTDNALCVLQSVSSLLAVGFSVDVPGLEAGEQVEDIGWVLRKKQKNERGESIRVELYPANAGLVKKHLHYYLDTPEQVAEFESATGLAVRSIPVYAGKDSVERGADEDTDKFIVKLPRPAKVVWRDNPAYDPDETDLTKKKPRRLFVRWDAVTPPPARPAMTAEQTSQAARPAMTAEQAAQVRVPSKTLVKDLDADKLAALAKGGSDWMTAEMVDAARFYVNSRK